MLHSVEVVRRQRSHIFQIIGSQMEAGLSVLRAGCPSYSMNIPGAKQTSWHESASEL
jgi:hypothetical protein